MVGRQYYVAIVESEGEIIGLAEVPGVPAAAGSKVQHSMLESGINYRDKARSKLNSVATLA